MNTSQKRKRLYVNIGIVSFLIIGTLIAIQFAKGYRPSLESKTIQGTGLLNLTSYPKSARVIINDRLTTVTDDKLYLAPGNYKVTIEKDGFRSWTKNLPIKPELVTNTDARLFPIIAATSPITFYQVKNASISPDGTKIAYTLNNTTQSQNNGLYIYSLSNNLLSSNNIQIAENTQSRNFADSLLIWSPDGSQILAVFTDKNLVPRSPNSEVGKIISSHVLSTKEKTTGTLTDATIRLPLIISQWQDQYIKINQPNLTLVPDFLKEILTNSSTNVYFSPDKEKVVYSPTIDTNLPENKIGAQLPNINSTPETRKLLKDKTYIFDLKEGTNYELTLASKSAQIQKNIILSVDSTPSADIVKLKQLKAQTESYYTSNIVWYSNSRQVIIINENGINLVDYDGQNLVNINPAKPLNNFSVPNTDGTKLVSLTNLNQKPDTFNLISFDLK